MILGISSDCAATGEPGLFLAHNKSGRYECRFSTVRIENSTSVMCKNMAGSSLGVWIAHGEGKVNITPYLSTLYKFGVLHSNE